MRLIRWQMVMTGVLLLSGGSLWAQMSAGMLEKQLDTPVTFEVRDKPIGEVFAKLSRESNVRFIVQPDTLAALPYGEQTRMDLRVPNVTLRKALPQILHPHGLTWKTQGDAVLIVPTDALYRINRRATFDEILLLGTLFTRTVTQAPADVPTVDILRTVTNAPALTLVLPDELLGEASELARRRAAQVLPASPAEWLDMLCGETYTWYLTGDRITVLERSAQLRRQLQRRVSLRYQNTRLVTVLLDLANVARTKLSLSPGALAMLPADVRSDFTLMMEDATIAQALEVISGATGLEFSLGSEGIDARPALGMSMYSPTVFDDAPGEAAAGPRRRAGLIVSTSFMGSDGKEHELLIPLFDLPDDILAQIHRQRAESILEMQKHWVVPADEADGSAGLLPYSDDNATEIDSASSSSAAPKAEATTTP